jgi:hypothetical protein
MRGSSSSHHTPQGHAIELAGTNGYQMIAALPPITWIAPVSPEPQRGEAEARGTGDCAVADRSAYLESSARIWTRRGSDVGAPSPPAVMPTSPRPRPRQAEQDSETVRFQHALRQRMAPRPRIRLLAFEEIDREMLPPR